MMDKSSEEIKKFPMQNNQHKVQDSQKLSMSGLVRNLKRIAVVSKHPKDVKRMLEEKKERMKQGLKNASQSKRNRRQAKFVKEE